MTFTLKREWKWFLKIFAFHLRLTVVLQNLWYAKMVSFGALSILLGLMKEKRLKKKSAQHPFHWKLSRQLERHWFCSLAITDDCTETVKHLLIFLSKLSVMLNAKLSPRLLSRMSLPILSWLSLWLQLVGPSCTQSKKTSSKVSSRKQRRPFHGKIWLMLKSMMKSTRLGCTLLAQSLAAPLCNYVCYYQ